VRSFILCDAVRSISTDRLSGQPWGVVTAATLAEVEDRLRMLLEL
jgi:mRNA-degrading endonuclease toxin of MazEF toxin-antitoxin module